MYDSSTDRLTTTLSGGRLTVRFDNGDENRIDYAVLDALASVCRSAADDPEVRVLALTGARGTFSAGAAADMGRWPDRFGHRRPEGSHGPAPLPEQDAVRALRSLMKPTVALLEGAVSGLALDLACVCDLRLALPDARIGDPRVRSGTAASTGIAYVLPRLIGQSQAMRILLLGETLDAAEALRIRLVHQIVETREAADAVIDRIATMPTRAWEVHKMQVLGQLDLDFESAMVHSLGVRQTHVIEDRLEGVQAWRERREPRFTGR
ncbi:MAG: hypothetical protein F4X99_07760 [Gammaproteobacteria bacterium]|nr:hypothetical protein [Gammaproteobacteria bacterium]